MSTDFHDNCWYGYFLNDVNVAWNVEVFRACREEAGDEPVKDVCVEG